MASTSPAAEPLRSTRFNVTGKSAAVDFIENRLPQYHPAFQNPPVFDPIANCFVSSRGQSSMQNQTGQLDSRLFWGSIFPDAMLLFQSRVAEPVILKNSKYRVRDRQDWFGVQDRLQAAQTTYIRVTGFKGWVRWPSRKFADNSNIASQSLRLIPGSDMTTSVINIVQSLLEVSAASSSRRQQYVLTYLGGEECSRQAQRRTRRFQQH
jgi:hypothetical protein